MKQLLGWVHRLGEAFLDLEQDEPVAPYVPPERLARQLELSLPETGRPIEEVMEHLGRILSATPRTASRRFFNQLYGGRDAAGTAAEMLTALTNTSMYTYKVAGPHVLIERELVRRMSELVWGEAGEGIFAPGGSLCILTAMLVARNEAEPAAGDLGLRHGVFRVYASAEAHYSVRRAAGLLGIGRRNLVSVATDSRGRMDPDALRAAIRADRQRGFRPMMICATSGTTVLGAFDPLDPIADVAEAEQVWLHVDGALGGSVLLSDRHRHLLEGRQRCDSFSWNPHKMLGVPLSCSVVLLRRPGMLARHLEEPAEYLFQSERDEYNPGKQSLQCGRRNDALKLWAAWQHHGTRGLGERVDRLFELAGYAADRVRQDPELELAATPQSVAVCFEVRGQASEAICDWLYRRGRMMIGYGSVGGRRVIRLVCIDPDLGREDIDTFFAEVKAAARALAQESPALATATGT